MCVYNILHLCTHVQLSVKCLPSPAASTQEPFLPRLTISSLQVQPVSRAYHVAQRLIHTGTALTHTQQLWDDTGARQHPHV